MVVLQRRISQCPSHAALGALEPAAAWREAAPAALWIVAGINLSRFDGRQFTTLTLGNDLPLTAVRNVREDRQNDLWIAGLSAIGKLSNGRFSRLIGAESLDGMFINPIVADRRDHLWFGGNRGLIMRSPDGKV